MPRFRLVVTSLLCGLLAACGGGPTSTIVEIDVVDMSNNPINPKGAAMQIGNGAWQSLLPSGTGKFKLSVPSGETRYGVAITCPFDLALAGAFQFTHIYQLTTVETTKLSTLCPSLGGNFSQVQGVVDTGLGTGSTYRISGWYPDYSHKANNSTYNIQVPSRSDADLLILGFSSSSTLQRARIVRNLDASSNLTGQNFTLGSGDNVTSQTVNLFTLPAGFSGKYSVIFRSKGNALGVVGQGPHNSGNYSALNGTVPQDLYFAIGSAYASNRTVTHIRSFSTPSDLTFSLPTEWPNGYTVSPAALPTFDNLTHLKDDTQFRAYQMLIYWSPRGFLVTNISKGWLGSSTSYSLPNLTAITGFSAKPFSGETVYWHVQAVPSNKTLGELLSTAPVFLDDWSVMGWGFAPLDGLEYKAADVRGSFAVP